MEAISIKQDYITLAQFLKHVNVISSGGQAKYYLLETPVLVNKIEENRRGKKLYNGDVIFVEGKEFIIKCI